VQSTLGPSKLILGGQTLKTPYDDLSAKSIGTLAMVTQGGITLSNLGGFLNATENGGGPGRQSFLRWYSNGDLFYRQGVAGSPELSFGNMAFEFKTSTGAANGQADGLASFGITSQEGLKLYADYVAMQMHFDVDYKAHPMNFDTTGRKGLLSIGWTGGLYQALFAIGSGGLGYGTYTVGSSTYRDDTGAHNTGPYNGRSDGLHIDSSWYFDSDFGWSIGEASGGNGVRFYNWKRWGGDPNGPMLSMPVIFDVVQNGAGPNGLCYGGGFSNGTPVQSSCTAADGEWVADGVPAGKAALGMFIRDGYLHAYNTDMDFTTGGVTSTYNWGLIFSYGKLDADAFIYPGGMNGNADGLHMDVLVMSQSPGFWQKITSTDPNVRATAAASWYNNSHFMLADGDVGGDPNQQYGLGLMNADLLWQAKDLYLRVTDNSTNVETLNGAALPGGLWLETSNMARYSFRGVLGGANLNDMTGDLTQVGLLYLDLNTDRFLFDLSPTDVGNARLPSGYDDPAPVYFDAYLHLVNSGYRYGEVSTPDAQFNLSNVQGSVAWQNGYIGLPNHYANQPTSTYGQPVLALGNDLLIGEAASLNGVAGSPLIGKMGYGTENIATVAIPDGQWHSDISMRVPQ
jgi:hypothetical protein